MVDDDDGDGFPSPEPRTDSRSALPREFRAWRWLRIAKRDESFSLFFLPKHEYMELELRSVEQQGAHEAGGLAQGGRRAPKFNPWSSCPITFDRRDHPTSIRHGGSAALVLDPIIDGFHLTRVLMDGGSSLNLLYQDTAKWALTPQELSPQRLPLKESYQV